MSDSDSEWDFGGAQPRSLKVPPRTPANRRASSTPFSRVADSDIESMVGDGLSSRSKHRGRLDSAGNVDTPEEKGRTASRETFRPIPATGEFDDDDARIIELKTQGYKDDYICDKLIREGRVRYTPGAVSTRYCRLRKVAEKVKNDRLDDELSDWHVGEDEHLEHSLKSLEDKYEREMQKLMDRKWKDVSVALEGRLQKQKYTGKACRERWEAIQAGTALKAIELDSDQEGRKALRETRIAEARCRRAEEIAESKRGVKNVEAIERRKELQEQKAIAEHEHRIAREAEREETRRIQEEVKRGNAEKKAAVQEAIALWKISVDEPRRVRELEERVYRSITGKILKRMRGPRDGGLDGVMLGGYESDETGANGDAEDDEMADLHGDGDEDRFPSTTNKGNAHTVGTSKPPKNLRFKVTKETLLNPRSILTDGELNILLSQRDLPHRGSRESHPQTVARLAAADVMLNGEQLTDLLAKYFDKGKGSKVAKALRLQTHEAQASAAGQRGVKATDLEFKKGYVGYEGAFAHFIEDDAEKN